MQISKALEDAIKEQNLVRIYGGFYVIAHENPNFSSGKFDETLRYVKSKNIPGFMQEYDGKEFAGQEKWTEEYWAEVVSDLIDNFCEERIRHLKEVGIFLFPVPKTSDSASRVTGKENSKAGQGGKRKAENSGRKPSSSQRDTRGFTEKVLSWFSGSNPSHDKEKAKVKERSNQVSRQKNSAQYRKTDERNRRG